MIYEFLIKNLTRNHFLKKLNINYSFKILEVSLLCTSISIYVNNFISCWFIASRFFTRKYCYFIEKRPRGSLPSCRLSCSSYRQDSEGWGE